MRSGAREVAAALVLGILVGLVGLSLRYPEQTVAFFSWLERSFGFAPGARPTRRTLRRQRRLRPRQAPRYVPAVHAGGSIRSHMLILHSPVRRLV